MSSSATTSRVRICPAKPFTEKKVGFIGIDETHVSYEMHIVEGDDDNGDATNSSTASAAASSSGRRPASSSSLVIARSYSEYRQFRNNAVQLFPWLALPTLPNPVPPMITLGNEQLWTLRELNIQIMLSVFVNGFVSAAAASPSSAISSAAASSASPSASTASFAAPRLKHFLDEQLGPQTVSAAYAQQQFKAMLQQQADSQRWVPDSFDMPRFVESVRVWDHAAAFCDKIAGEVATLKEIFTATRQNLLLTANAVEGFGAAFDSLVADIAQNDSSLSHQEQQQQQQPAAAASSSSSSPSSGNDRTAESFVENHDGAAFKSANALVTVCGPRVRDGASNLSDLYRHRATESHSKLVEQFSIVLHFVDGARDLATRRRDQWIELLRQLQAAAALAAANNTATTGQETMDADTRRKIAALSDEQFELLHQMSFAQFRELFLDLWPKTLDCVRDAFLSRPPQQQQQQQQSLS